jgi:hypothetical protein
MKNGSVQVSQSQMMFGGRGGRVWESNPPRAWWPSPVLKTGSVAGRHTLPRESVGRVRARPWQPATPRAMGSGRLPAPAGTDVRFNGGKRCGGGSVADPRDAVRVVRRVNLAAVPGSDRRGEHEPPDQADEKHGDGRKSDLRYGERARKARGSRVSCPHRILPRV